MVIVEWDKRDLRLRWHSDLHWQYSEDYLTREGYVHVSVQAQRVGIHGSADAAGLKGWSLTRYSSAWT